MNPIIGFCVRIKVDPDTAQEAAISRWLVTEQLVTESADKSMTYIDWAILYRFNLEEKKMHNQFKHIVMRNCWIFYLWRKIMSIDMNTLPYFKMNASIFTMTKNIVYWTARTSRKKFNRCLPFDSIYLNFANNIIQRCSTSPI